MSAAFVYAAAAAAPVVEPILGPVGGGTLVRLGIQPQTPGLIAVAGPTVTCRFAGGANHSATDVPGSFRDEHGLLDRAAVRCATPARGGGGEEIVLVARNGQQFEGVVPAERHAASFFFYTPPTAQAIWPRSGAARRRHAHRAQRRWCRVARRGRGARVQIWGDHGRRRRHRRRRGLHVHRAGLCRRRRRRGELRDEQRPVGAAPLCPAQRAADAPARRLRRLRAAGHTKRRAADGVHDGRRSASPRGAWLTPGAATEHWCAFGPAPTGCTQTGCPAVRLVPATIVGWDHLACVAPSADAAGARVEVAVDFGDAAAVGARATMWGDAALLDGALRLSAIGPESHLPPCCALPPLPRSPSSRSVSTSCCGARRRRRTRKRSGRRSSTRSTRSQSTGTRSTSTTGGWSTVALSPSITAPSTTAPRLLDDLGASHGGISCDIRARWSAKAGLENDAAVASSTRSQSTARRRGGVRLALGITTSARARGAPKRATCRLRTPAQSSPTMDASAAAYCARRGVARRRRPRAAQRRRREGRACGSMTSAS